MPNRRVPRVGVHIVHDSDFEPGADGDANAKYATTPAERTEFQDFARDARARHASGEWSAYGLQAVHECLACGDPHLGTASLWGVEMETTTAVDSVIWDLAALGEDSPTNYLRTTAAEIMAEEQDLLTARLKRAA